MKVNSNIQALYAQTILSYNESKMAKSTQKMSSGYKINRAMDNPAGMAISNRMRAQLQSLDRANKNAKNAVNAVQTAEGGMSEIEDMLQRMSELSIQAANGTMTPEDRDAIQEEVTQLTNEISRISKNTTYNTQALLNGESALKGYSSKPESLVVRNYNEQFDLGDYKVSVDGNGVASLSKIINGTATAVNCKQELTEYRDAAGNITGRSIKLNTSDGGELTVDVKGSAAVSNVELDIMGIGGMKIQTGSEEGHEIQVVIPDMSLKALGLEDLDGNRTLDFSSQESAKRSIDIVTKAIDYVSESRSKIGAYQNRIENTISNLDVTIENLTESYSTIKDLDMAEGMVEYTTLQVLIQAGTTMLAQANEQPQQALQLLQ